MKLRHLTLLLLVLTSSCGTPDKANIVLRKKNQQLEGQVEQLKGELRARDAQIHGYADRVGTVPTLPPARLEKLFTTYAIRVGRLTGGVDLDPSKPGDEAFRVYVNTLDKHGDMIKSAGSFVIEAFDLSGSQPSKLGHWEFPVEKAQENWYSFFTRYEYVLTCPWQEAVPRRPEVTVRLTFTDELTGRKFTAQKVAKVNLPPARAATQPVGLLR